ncbi:MAG TPA: ABC transporter permease [Vicinamibacterales bacterium]|nr:ABC transporter permease [Vicinamibacterales bacterium]
MLDDARYALRGFRKTPVFTAVAILTLTLAVGANTALFSLLNALALRDLPVRDPGSLMLLHTITPTTNEGGFSLPMLREIARQQQSYASLVGWLSNGIVNVETETERSWAAVSTVTGNYFSELGVQPAAGRLLTAQDVDMNGLTGAPVAVLGYSFWQRFYRGDPSIVGRTIRVERVPLTIVGVAPRGFTGFGLVLEQDVTVPITLLPQLRFVPSEAALRSGIVSPIRVVGRLRPDVTIDQAAAEAATLWPAIREATVPASYAGAQRERFMATRIGLKSAANGLETRLRDRYMRPLAVVMSIAALVLLIACVNLASLMLSRAAARTHEIGVRLALGAGRWQLVRQMLVEGLLLSLAGAAIGLVFAYWSGRAIVDVMFADYMVPARLDVAPDVRVVAFTSSLAILVGVVFSLAPAWRATRRSAVEALQQSTRTSTGVGRAGRRLVAAQVALSLVLLTNAGLLVRSLQEIRAVPSGLQADDVFVTFPAPLPGGYAPAGAGGNDTYYPQLVARLMALPGMARASISLTKPAGGFSSQTTPVALIAEADLLTHGIGAIRTAVSPGFFDTLGMSIVSGRDFSWSDTSRGRRVAIVSRSLARKLFDGGPVLGERIRIGVRPEDQDVEVIGVASDARLYDLTSSNLYAAYVPALQDPNPDAKCFVLRGRGVSLRDLKQTVESFGREQVGSTQSLSYITGRTLLQERMTATLAAFFGGLALVLAAIGLYGLMTYAVTQRRREIGIRVALGAEPLRVMAGVVAGGLAITLGGIAVGFAAALATVQLVKSLLFGVTAYDPLTFVAAPTSLIVITVIACLFPAARAARVDPALALRAE